MNQRSPTSTFALLMLSCLALVHLGCVGNELPLSPDTLRSAPNVASVRVRGAKDPTRRIVHLRNFHFVEGMAADQLETCKAVQRELEELLVHLIEKHGVREIYLEGLTPENQGLFIEQVEALRQFDPRKAEDQIVELDQLIEQAEDLEAEEQIGAAMALRGQLQAALVQQRNDLLRLGAPGRLFLAGKLDLLAVEDEAAFAAAEPAVGGKIVIDQEAQERREAAIVQKLCAHGRTAIVVLGAGHDLSNHIPAVCEYVEVSLAGIPTDL